MGVMDMLGAMRRRHMKTQAATGDDTSGGSGGDAGNSTAGVPGLSFGGDGKPSVDDFVPAMPATPINGSNAISTGGLAKKVKKLF